MSKNNILGANSGSRERSPSGLGPADFDPGREMFMQRIILAIASASVPHPSPLVGGLEARSLSYYLGIGIDHFGHAYERHEALLRRAAELVIEAIAMEARQGLDHEDGLDGVAATARASQEASPEPSGPRDPDNG